MKKLLFVVLLTATCSSQAQNTAQAWEFRQAQCENMARQAGSVYDMKVHAPRQYQIFRPDPGSNGKLTIFSQWAFDFVTTTTMEKESAVRVVFAKCIDNIDRIYRDDGNTPSEQFR
jgi:hypothetical protein